VLFRSAHADIQDDGDALFSKLKHALFAWAVLHDVHMSVLANVGDTPVEEDKDGILVIPSHFNAQWVRRFMMEVEANPKKVSDDWKGNAAKWEENLTKAVTSDALLAEWGETRGEEPQGTGFILVSSKQPHIPSKSTTFLRPRSSMREWATLTNVRGVLTIERTLNFANISSNCRESSYVPSVELSYFKYRN
jgi:hypothetical protein